MHHYPFHVGDYKSHSGHLDLLEDLAYRRMLDYIYLNEIPLPQSVEEIGRLICMRSNYDCITVVLREFFYSTDCGGWMNKRAALEIGKYHAKSDKAKASITARWDKARKLKEKGDTDVLPTNYDCNTNQNQNQNQNQEPITSLVVQDNAPAKAVAKQSTNGTRLPAEWQLPKALGEWAVDQGLNRDSVIAESERFRDYWIAQPGAKGRKTDWPATWRNWIRNRKPDNSKSFAEQSQDFKDAQAKKHYRTLSTMTDEERKAWGFDK